jgi:hypothetical protein
MRWFANCQKVGICAEQAWRFIMSRLFFSGLFIFLLCGCSGEPAVVTAPAVSPSAAPAAPAAAADFSKVAGRWTRTDGEYALVLKDVRPDGTLTAGYFNPNPINVSKAEVRAAGNKLNVFVELRDTNYPGCTYTLTYHPEQDLLAGVYFQAMVQEQYEVSFARAKD